jgi:hypothetical protein
MPEVFEGGTGDLVIFQEWPNLEEEGCVRVIIPMHRALDLATAIIDCYREAAFNGVTLPPVVRREGE